MRRIICTLSTALACSLPFSRLSAAESKPKDPAISDQAARVAFTSFPPWTFKNQGGQYAGILVDYLRDVAKDINLSLKEEDIPIARLHHSMRQGRLDLFFTKAAFQPLECCASLGKSFDSETVILRLKQGPAWNAAHPGDSSICRVGLSGYSVAGFKMYDADSPETCIRMVLRGRLPYLIGERYSLTSVLQSQSKSIVDNFAEPIVLDLQQYDLFITKSLDQSSYGPLLRKAIEQRKLSDYMSRYLAPKP